MYTYVSLPQTLVPETLCTSCSSYTCARTYHREEQHMNRNEEYISLLKIALILLL